MRQLSKSSVQTAFPAKIDIGLIDYQGTGLQHLAQREAIRPFSHFRYF
jgi:hypothetical protein